MAIFTASGAAIVPCGLHANQVPSLRSLACRKRSYLRKRPPVSGLAPGGGKYVVAPLGPQFRLFFVSFYVSVVHALFEFFLLY